MKPFTNALAGGPPQHSPSVRDYRTGSCLRFWQRSARPGRDVSRGLAGANLFARRFIRPQAQPVLRRPTAEERL